MTHPPGQNTLTSMRRSWLIVFLPALLISCGGTATLYTDDLLSASAPEIIRAWEGLRPFHDARLATIDPADLNGLRAALKEAPAGSSALVGVSLGAQALDHLPLEFPQLKFVFLGPSARTSPSLKVNRGQAWAAVAKAAARADRGPGTVLFPSNGSAAERALFTEAWNQAGGGPLTCYSWPQTGDLPRGTGQVFQWVGPEADALIESLPPTRAVHGDPGLARAPGAKGYVWSIQTAGLGEYLWDSAQNFSKKMEFLPVETVPPGR